MRDPHKMSVEQTHGGAGSPTTVDVNCVSCAECPIGRASGASSVLFCPFIIRTYSAGHILCRADEPARYVWFVKEGVIGLARPGDRPDQLAALRLAGGAVGLESLVAPTYALTAKVLARATLCGAPVEALFLWLGQDPARLALVIRAALSDSLLVEQFG